MCNLLFYILHGLFFSPLKTSQWLFNVLIISTEINSSSPPLKHCAIITFTWQPLTTKHIWIIDYRIMFIMSKQHSQRLHSKNTPKGVNTLLIDQKKKKIQEHNSDQTAKWVTGKARHDNTEVKKQTTQRQDLSYILHKRFICIESTSCG